MDRLKALQRDQMNAAFAVSSSTHFESHPFHDHFRAIPFERLHKLLERRGVDLNGKSVLIAGCGDGIDLHYLRKYYRSEFSVADLSTAAIAKVRERYPEVTGHVQDMEELSFADDSFDYVFVSHGLHHLPRPMRGLYELLRVSRYGLLVIEPYDNWLTRLATRLGLATEIEESGNYVYRFSVRDVERVGRAAFTRVAWDHFFAIHRVAKGRAEFQALRLVNALANRVCPGLGNYLAFFVEKPR
jgi:ubiquinone/menaquinone biosynthesis C-methylase UbiE